jgi:hypothetical protein
MWRRIQLKGFAQKYKDQNFRMHCKMFTSLTFVKPDDIMFKFEKIKDVCNGYGNDFYMQIITYFQHTFLKSFDFLKKWNAVERINFGIVSTSYCVEACNNNFAKKFDRPHTNMAQFISTLQSYQGVMEKDISDALLCFGQLLRKKNIVKMEKLKGDVPIRKITRFVMPTVYCTTLWLEV